MIRRSHNDKIKQLQPCITCLRSPWVQAVLWFMFTVTRTVLRPNFSSYNFPANSQFVVTVHFHLDWAVSLRVVRTASPDSNLASVLAHTPACTSPENQEKQGFTMIGHLLLAVNTSNCGTPAVCSHY